MNSFGQKTWQSHARLIALLCWASAIALTGNMGWHAWTSMRDTSGGAQFRSGQVDTALAGVSLTSNEMNSSDKKPVAP